MTSNQFKTLEDLYQYYNQKLFGGKLANCLVNLSRHGGAYGFFAPKEWIEANASNKKTLGPSVVNGRKKGRVIHEISINPDSMYRTEKAWHSTLVHEMVHLWQEDWGKPPRQCYHNQQWADKMESIGLMPSATGRIGGVKTGQFMSHYIIPGGEYEKVFAGISPEDYKRLTLPYSINRQFMDDIGLDDEMANALAWLKALSPEPVIKGKKVDIYTFLGINRKAAETGSSLKIKYSCDCYNNIWGKAGLYIKCMDCGEIFQQN
jgi:SprT-like family